MKRILQLQELGQSVWLDYIERTMIQQGELQRLVENGVVGVTSNPTIFEKAITGSAAYDSDLTRLAASGKGAKAIFEELAIADIRAAADVLQPIYARSQRRDGYVSLEVAPDLAHDAQATIVEARRLFQQVDRPNVMVKVPATAAGALAIEQLIAEGLNINVTLIFSRTRYAAVQEAYLRGLEARHRAGQPLDQIASVASFFVSRVDSLVDKQLRQLQAAGKGSAAPISNLMGKAAIANAQLAYAQFTDTFAGPRWHKLAQAGATRQRPLWASTSTKDPSYSDVMYVDELIGPDTVNTLPMETLTAFADHGTPRRTVDQELAAANAVMAGLAAVGIDMAAVAETLEAEGVQKFADSYTQLLAAITQRAKAMA